MNVKSHNSSMQNDVPKFFSFSGISSDITRNGIVRTPKDATNMMKEKLVIGIQLNGRTSTPFASNNE